MKTRLFPVLVALFFAVGMNAQVKNIGAGAAFFGDIRLAVQGAEDHGNLYVCSYRPVLGGTAYYEMSSGSASHMFEIDYLTAPLAGVKESEKYYIKEWESVDFQPAKVITGFYYIGINNRSAQRFQLPFYFGVGLSYNDAARSSSWVSPSVRSSGPVSTSPTGSASGAAARPSSAMARPRSRPI